MNTAPKTLSELAALVGGRVLGDGGIQIRKVAAIDEAGAGDITFLVDPRYRTYLSSCKASAIIVGKDLETGPEPDKNFLQVDQPYLAFAKILQVFSPQPQFEGEISPNATIHPTAIVKEGATVFPYVYVGAGATIGRDSVLFPGVFVGQGAEIGDDCVLHPQVTVRDGCRIGNRVILHAGVVVGSDGFGYAAEGGARAKIPQVGTVEVHDDVEIGANTTVDRATLGRTVIGRGVKIDNLVQIAHNVVVGDDSVIVAQAGIAGSTRIGRGVILAGQVGVVNHIEIGDGARIGPQSGVAQSVPPGVTLSSGLNAAPHNKWLKVMALLPRLPQLWTEVRRLERKVGALSRATSKKGKTHDGR